MNHTTRHILFAVGWLIFVPLVLVSLVISGAVDASSLRPFAGLVSLVWSLGFVGIFAAWAFRDAPAHGKSKAAAIAFSAAWFLIFALAVIPYLYYTRGVREGTIAALKFVSLCLGIAILFVGIPSAFNRLF